MNFSETKINVSDWSSLLPYYNDLINREISSVKDLEKWLHDRSLLNAVLDEDLAWRYINMTRDTQNKSFVEKFEIFVNEIQPEISKQEFILNKKFAESPFFSELSPYYDILKRSTENEIKLYREENLKLSAEDETLAAKYGKISGEMTVSIKGEEVTLQAASNHLKSLGRNLREETYKKIWERRFQDSEKLDLLLSELIEKRHQIALNAGFSNYRDFQHTAKERFDYSVDDVLLFDDVIAERVMPVVNNITTYRREKLGYERLKPWDLEVSLSQKPPLKVFSEIDEFVEKTIHCFSLVRPAYGEYMREMRDKKFLDLDSRKGKAPGGYNYPLLVSGVPFIFMNATSNVRDLETLVHEGGHAIHAFKSKNLSLSEYKNTPSEIAELASMSMELISMEHWDVFFSREEDLREAKIHQLEGVISVLPWVATIDKFQHWLYTHVGHSVEQRHEAWQKIFFRYASPEIDFSEAQKYLPVIWQKQLHIFEVPFYYIEYAIAQLGAIAVWRNYRESPEQALDAYEAALSLGYSEPLPRLYEKAGIKFDFSQEYIGELMDFVNDELTKLYATRS